MTEEPPLAAVHGTKFSAAAMRALQLFRDEDPKVLRDEYALGLTGWTEEQVLDLAARVEKSPLTRSTGWVCRARLAEDRLALARGRGVGQYVVLGAGLDSYALRHSDDLGDLVVYEVDDPPMQEWKRWRMDQLNL